MAAAMPRSAARRSHAGRSGPSPIRRSRACGHAAWTRAKTWSRSRWFFTASKRAMQATTLPEPECGCAARAYRSVSMPLPTQRAGTPRQWQTTRRSSRFWVRSISVKSARVRSAAHESTRDGSRAPRWKWNPCTVWTTIGTPAARAASRPTTPGTELCVWTRSGLQRRKNRARRQVALASAAGSSPRGVSMTATGRPARRIWSTWSPALQTIQLSTAGGRWKCRARSSRISLAEAAVLITSTMRRLADMAASQARAVPGGPPVQREQGPELLRAIGSAGHVLRVERVDGVPPHARQEAAPRGDDVTEEVPELAAEPLTGGGLEAALAPADDLGGQHVPERLAKNALAAQRADLPAARDPEGVFDHPMVQERNANLEGVGHARRVDLGEHVPREPEPSVGVEHTVDPVDVVERADAQRFGREQVGG